MSADQITTLVKALRRQIGIAEDAGADHEDLCIAVPPSYLTLVVAWPTVEIQMDEDIDATVTVAVVPKLWARDLADEAVAECSTAPLDLRDCGADGLWGFTTPITSLADLRTFAKEHGADWTDPLVQTRFMLEDQ